MWTAASLTSRTLVGQVSILRSPLACSQFPKDLRPNLGRLAPQRKPIERKQITVLFADLNGSMELLSERDPEEALKILDPVLDHMRERFNEWLSLNENLKKEHFSIIVTLIGIYLDLSWT